MKKIKLEKGITLIALIITIIVLLILAGVAIATVQESDIIGHAKNVVNTYQTKVDEENAVLDGYLAAIEDNLSGEGTEDGDDTLEEIVWVYEELDNEKWLYFIGNTKELYIAEDKALKAYVGKDNDGEIEYDEKRIVTVKLSEVNGAYITTEIEKATVGKVANKVYFSKVKEVVVLGDYTDIPSTRFGEHGIENLIIKEGVETIANSAFSKNNLKSITLPVSIIKIANGAFSGFSNQENNIINYCGTKEQWDKIEMDVTMAFGAKGYRTDIKVVFNDGAEIVI